MRKLLYIGTLLFFVAVIFEAIFFPHVPFGKKPEDKFIKKREYTKSSSTYQGYVYDVHIGTNYRKFGRNLSGARRYVRKNTKSS